MAYASDEMVNSFLSVLNGLDIRLKKMFGCYCVYCDGQPVGFLTETNFSMKDVGLADLPDTLRRPRPDMSSKEIPVTPDQWDASWMPRAVQQTADYLNRDKYL